MNILVVKPSSLGDIVHTFPAVELIRRAHPDAMIDWVANDQFVELVGLLPAVDEVIAFRRKRWGQVRHVLEIIGFVRELRQRRYDIVLDFQGLLRSGLIAWASGSSRRVGFAAAREGAGFFYTDRVPIPANLRHAVERNVFLVRSALSVSLPVTIPTLGVQHDLAKSARQAFTSAGLQADRPVLAVAPAARWETKQWPPAFFAAVIDAVTRSVPEVQTWLLGTADEAAIGAAVCRECSVAAPRSLMGASTLGTLTEMLRLSDVLLSNDSGPMHLAAAIGVPVVALFGPTDPELTGPYGDAHAVFTGECDYRPCFSRQCPLAGQRCSVNASPSGVVKAVVERVHSRRRR